MQQVKGALSLSLSLSLSLFLSLFFFLHFLLSFSPVWTFYTPAQALPLIPPLE
ncbi:MAG: hypothetical protein ACRC4N_12680 [Gammaproteobacteria bacterium]